MLEQYKSIYFLTWRTAFQLNSHFECKTFPQKSAWPFRSLLICDDAIAVKSNIYKSIFSPRNGNNICLCIAINRSKGGAEIFLSRLLFETFCRMNDIPHKSFLHPFFVSHKSNKTTHKRWLLVGSICCIFHLSHQ